MTLNEGSLSGVGLTVMLDGTPVGRRRDLASKRADDRTRNGLTPRPQASAARCRRLVVMTPNEASAPGAKNDACVAPNPSDDDREIVGTTVGIGCEITPACHLTPPLSGRAEQAQPAC